MTVPVEGGDAQRELAWEYLQDGDWPERELFDLAYSAGQAEAEARRANSIEQAVAASIGAAAAQARAEERAILEAAREWRRCNKEPVPADSFEAIGPAVRGLKAAVDAYEEGSAAGGNCRYL